MKHSLVIFCGLILGATSCNNNTTPHQKENIDNDTVAVSIDTPQQQQPVAKNINYAAWAIKSSDSLKKELKKFTKEELRIIEVLNRADAKHLTRIDTILIPDQFHELIEYSIFPTQVAAIKEIPKIIYFSYPAQAFGVYENGNLVKWGPTNMGKKATPTPNGLFFANWKGLEVRSSVNSSWILKWNFNVHNTLGVGWHQYDLPGYPASHSCMRLLADDAKWLYSWADQWKVKDGQLKAKGTPTVVFGDYPWGERRPWKALLENPNALNITADSIENIMAPYLDKIKSALQEREQYLNSLDTNKVQQSI